MEFLLVPAGEYVRGSPDSEAGRQRDEGPPHRVRLSQPFWLWRYEVTQRQWQAVTGENPSTFVRYDTSPDHPVERVSWDDAAAFAERLGSVERGRFRLPTEAEWEYACRAGTSGRYCFADAPEPWELARHGWFCFSKTEGRSHPVGQKKPNPWGFYDLPGSVWEWCSDTFGPYPADTGDEPLVDPLGPPPGELKVIRGGSWFNEPEALRSANRHRHKRRSRQTNIGLRLVWQPPSKAN